MLHTVKTSSSFNMQFINGEVILSRTCLIEYILRSLPDDQRSMTSQCLPKHWVILVLYQRLV